MNIAIILAGGYGSRFLNQSNKFPKQFYEFCRKEVIAYSLETFNKHPQIDKIVVVSNIEYIKKTEEIIKKYNFEKGFSYIRNRKYFSCIYCINP